MSSRVFGGLIPENVVRATTDAATGAAMHGSLGSTTVAFHNLATPEQFGAVGDGVADDGVAVSAAVNSALFAGIKATPGKTYLCKNISVPSNKTLDLRGATFTWGGSFGTAPISENVSTVFYVQGTVGARLSNIQIIGGTIRGSRTGTDFASTGGASPEQDSLSIQYADNVNVSGVYFIDTKQDAISLDLVTSVHVDACWFVDSGDVCVDIRSGEAITVTNNYATRVRSLVSCKPNIDSVVVSGNDCATFGIGITGHGPNWRICDNTIRVTSTPDAQDGVDANAIEIYETGGGATGVAFKRCLIEGNIIIGRSNAYGIYLRDSPNGDHANVVIASNNIDAKTGIVVSVGDAITIGNNIIEATTGGAIAISAGTNIAICGNTVTSTTGTAIQTAAVGTVISDNTVRTTGSVQGIVITSAAVGTALTGNKIRGGTVGIALSAADVAVTGNEIVSDSGAAITIGGIDNFITGNRLKPTSGEGVLISAAGATVTGNRISGGTQGVRMSASNSVVSGNRISGAQFWGVSVTAGAVDSVIVGNSLVGNTSGAITDAGTTTLAASNRP